MVVSMTEYFFSILKTPGFRFLRPHAFDNNPNTGEMYGKNVVVKVLVKIQLPYISNQFLESPVGISMGFHDRMFPSKIINIVELM